MTFFFLSLPRPKFFSFFSTSNGPESGAVSQIDQQIIISRECSSKGEQMNKLNMQLQPLQLQSILQEKKKKKRRTGREKESNGQLVVIHGVHARYYYC